MFRYLSRLYSASALGSVGYIIKDTETSIISDKGVRVLANNKAMAKVFEQIDSKRKSASDGEQSSTNHILVELDD